GPQDRLAQPRSTRERYSLRVHRPVGLEVVDRAANPPRPGADGAPLVGAGPRLSRLQGQPDDPFGPTLGPIRLDVGVPERGVPPPGAQDLAYQFDPAGAPPLPGGEAKRDAQEHWHRLLGLDRGVDRQVHPWASRLVAHLPNDAPPDRRALPCLL